MSNRILSEAQLAANRANAQKSTGPTSPEGKQRSSMNALKHGLTARTRVLPSENQAEYDQLLTDYFNELQPKSRVESDLIEDLVSIRWQLRRIRAGENAILELEMAKPGFADEFDEIVGSYRTALAAIKTAGNAAIAHINRQAARLTREFERLLKSLFDYRRNTPPAADTPTVEIDWPSAADYRPPQDPCMQNKPGTAPPQKSTFAYALKPLARAA